MAADLGPIEATGRVTVSCGGRGTPRRINPHGPPTVFPLRADPLTALRFHNGMVSAGVLVVHTHVDTWRCRFVSGRTHVHGFW